MLYKTQTIKLNGNNWLHLFDPRLHLFEQKYNKVYYTIKYDYNFK